MPRASPPNGTGPFVSRRDRPEHQQRRAGTGRQITSREFGVLGRHTGAKLQQTTKDFQGFDDLDQAWRSDDDDGRDNGVALQHRSSLFPESPMSASTVPNDPEPEPAIAGKRLEFTAAGQNDEDEEEIIPNEDVASDPVSLSDHDEPEEPVPEKTLTTDYSDGAKGRAIKEKGKKPSRKPKAKKVKSVTKPSKNDDSKRKRSSRSQGSSSPGSAENDENQEPAAQQAHDDSGSFTEDEAAPIPSPAAVKSKPAKSSTKQSKTSSSGKSKKKKRRQTLVIIDEAQESGLIDEDTMVVENDKLVRRSQRSRCRPVNFFQCEQPNYVRGPGGLFSLDRDKAIIKHVPSPPPPPSRRSRHKRRRPKSRDESSDEEDEELLPLSGETKVIGTNGKERRQIVAVRASDHSATKIGTKPPAGEKPQDKDLTGTICKFDGLDGVAAGVVQIPPSGTKYPETVSRAEVFFIASCERNSLLVKVHNHEFKLSRGDTFMVPAKNTYSIQNASRRKPAKLFFSAMRA